MSTTAASAGLLSCHACGRLRPAHASGAPARCPRCAAALHERKPQSLARTWALLLAAAILYVPANVLPVSRIVSFGAAQADTILSGVQTLFHEGDAPIALLLFFASIVVPLLKITILAWLLLSVQFRWLRRTRDRTVAYRLIEAIGRWSMLDIFVISLLVALLRLEALATFEAGPGATAFAGVVVLTMLAAASFDPRLLWDLVEDER